MLSEGEPQVVLSRSDQLGILGVGCQEMQCGDRKNLVEKIVILKSQLGDLNGPSMSDFIIVAGSKRLAGIYDVVLQKSQLEKSSRLAFRGVEGIAGLMKFIVSDGTLNGFRIDMKTGKAKWRAEIAMDHRFCLLWGHLFAPR
jgi:hypothetical protein